MPSKPNATDNASASIASRSGGVKWEEFANSESHSSDFILTRLPIMFLRYRQHQLAETFFVLGVGRAKNRYL